MPRNLSMIISAYSTATAPVNTLPTHLRNMYAQPRTASELSTVEKAHGLAIAEQYADAQGSRRAHYNGGGWQLNESSRSLFTTV
jgi:hypothetical protein